MGIERLHAHNESGFFYCALDLMQQNATRLQFNFLNDADGFTLD
jgi:hypothetical protein